jgi:hypothetical protein
MIGYFNGNLVLRNCILEIEEQSSVENQYTISCYIISAYRGYVSRPTKLHRLPTLWRLKKYVIRV